MNETVTARPDLVLVPGHRYVVVYRQQKGNYQWWEMSVTATYHGQRRDDIHGRPVFAFHGRPRFDTFDLPLRRIVSATETANPPAYSKNIRRIPPDAVRPEWV